MRGPTLPPSGDRQHPVGHMQWTPPSARPSPEGQPKRPFSYPLMHPQHFTIFFSCNTITTTYLTRECHAPLRVPFAKTKRFGLAAPSSLPHTKSRPSATSTGLPRPTLSTIQVTTFPIYGSTSLTLVSPPDTTFSIFGIAEKDRARCFR